jgi:hypothetical protein
VLASVRVEANRPWTDTRLVVREGERFAFVTTGTVSFIKGQSIGPEGHSATQPGADFPVRDIPVGGLIARIGSGPAFPIGSSQEPIAMPAGGRLFLGVNDNYHADNSGVFNVQIHRR